MLIEKLSLKFIKSIILDAPHKVGLMRIRKTLWGFYYETTSRDKIKASRRLNFDFLKLGN